MAYVFLGIVVVLTTLWQILFKWRSAYVSLGEGSSDTFMGKLLAMLQSLLDPYIFAGYACALLSSVLWIFALKKVPLSVAYPFLSLPMVFVMGLSAILFHEALDVYKITGAALIIAGIVLIGLKAG